MSDNTHTRIEKLERQNRFLKTLLRLLITSLDHNGFWNYCQKTRSEDLSAILEELKI